MTIQFRAESHGAAEPGTVFVEHGIVTHDGREFASGGAFITDDRLIAYLGQGEITYPARTITHDRSTFMHGRTVHYPEHKGGKGNVCTWEGAIIGRYTIVKTWRVPCRHMGWYDMAHVTIQLTDGRKYHGRSQGPGMIVHARRVVADLRRTK